MGNTVRSAKGELVDFDLLKIKQQIASSPPTTDVRARQDFIDKRLRHRVKKVPTPAPKINAELDVDVDKKLPSPVDIGTDGKFIDEVKPKKSSQKARPKLK